MASITIRMIVTYTGRCAWQVFVGDECIGKYFTEAAANNAAEACA
jgi:ribosomal protein S19